MKKLILLLITFLSLSATAQTIPSYKNIKLTSVPESTTKSDSLVSIGANGLLTKTKRSSLFQDVTNFVPYNGALSDVDLNKWSLSAGSLSVTSEMYPERFFYASSDNQIVAVGDYNYNKNGTSLAVRDFDRSITFNIDNPNDVTINGNSILTTASAPTGVPYTGATQNLDLGVNNVTATNLYCQSSNFPVGFLVADLQDRILKLGDWNYDQNHTYLNIDDQNKRISLNAEGDVRIGNSYYSSGMLYIGKPDRTISIGDSFGANNNNYLKIDDANGVISVNSPSGNFKFNGSNILNEFYANAYIFDGVTSDGNTMNKLNQKIDTNFSTLLNYYVKKGSYNSTTTALTSGMLNSQYPSAQTGYKVYCTNITAGKMIYEKSVSGWVGYSCVIP